MNKSVIIIGTSLVSIFLLINMGCTSVYKGTLVSAVDSQPIEGAEVVLQNYNCAPSIIVKTKSDKAGNFKLKIPTVIGNCLKGNVEVNVISETHTAVASKLESEKGKNIIKLLKK